MTSPGATSWDVIADAQLWLPAMLFQGLRFVLPFSEIFTVILHHMVRIVSGLESDGLLKVAYYRETTAFVKYLQNIGYEVVVTGHSLGKYFCCHHSSLALHPTHSYYLF